MKTIALNEREKLLLKVLAGVLAVALPLIIGGSLWRYQNRLAAEVETSRRLLTEAMTLDAELARMDRSRGSPAAAGGSLIGYLEQLADRAGVKQRVQLNPVSQNQPGRAQSVDVRLDTATLDEMVRLIYAIENAEVNLAIEQVEVAPSFKEKDLLRVSVRVIGAG